MKQFQPTKPEWLKRLHVTAHFGHSQTNCPECRKAMHNAPENAQMWATLLWNVATDNDPNVARYDGPVYQGLDEMFLIAYERAYPGDPSTVRNRVRDLLASNGPDDGYNGQPGKGIASYRLGALAEYYAELATAELVTPPNAIDWGAE